MTERCNNDCGVDNKVSGSNDCGQGKAARRKSNFDNRRCEYAAPRDTKAAYQMSMHNTRNGRKILASQEPSGYLMIMNKRLNIWKETHVIERTKMPFS